MPDFIHRNFLLRSKTAVGLYEQFAKDLPIVDYHCHLEPEWVAGNESYADIVDLWITIDPYKWRAMRINGIKERFITGDGSYEEKFKAFAETLPRLVGSPVYHWSALELKRYFGIDRRLDGSSASEIREECNRQLRNGLFGTSDILTRSNLETVCTSDNWLSDLGPHSSTQDSAKSFSMRPSLRGDAALRVDSPGYIQWLADIGCRTHQKVDSLEALKESLSKIMDEFAAAGCTLSDHSLNTVSFCLVSERQAAELFSRLLAGASLTSDESSGLRTHLFAFLASEYAHRNWTLQLHLGAQRETSSALMNSVSTPGGIACVGDSVSSVALSQLFDYVEGLGGLPRVIIYPLNIADFEKIASLSGAFVEEGVWGKVQLGPPWWFNDHYDGIVHQLKVFANYSALGRFVGMATDTRSPLSMARFEYFRRIFCNLIGGWVEDGRLPNDSSLLEPLIKDVCYYNAAQIVGSVAVETEVEAS